MFAPQASGEADAAGMTGATVFPRGWRGSPREVLGPCAIARSVQAALKAVG
jgi:hypothetical protein